MPPSRTLILSSPQQDNCSTSLRISKVKVKARNGQVCAKNGATRARSRSRLQFRSWRRSLKKRTTKVRRQSKQATTKICWMPLLPVVLYWSIRISNRMRRTKLRSRSVKLNSLRISSSRWHPIGQFRRKLHSGAFLRTQKTNKSEASSGLKALRRGPAASWARNRCRDRNEINN